MKIDLVLGYLVYVLINLFFIIKYSNKIDINSYWLAVLYVFFCLVFFNLYKFFKKNSKTLFIVVSILFFLLTIYINFSVDGNTLNVDRWSAMQVAVEALLNGEYPYSAIDHLGGRTSNLPTLIFIGIPFYLIGNIGLLQSFGFLVFVFTIHKIFVSYSDKLFCLLLLVTSPAYLWEIYVKSDLMTNFIILLLFLVIFEKRKSLDDYKSITLLSFFSTALLLTRLTTIIPIAILVFKKFINYSLKKKFLFISVSFMVTLFFLFICFNKAESLAFFKMYNPFTLQNRQLPFWLSFATVVISVLYSFKVHNLKTLINYSVVGLLLPIVIAMLLNIYSYGFHQSIIGSSFDISYLNIVMPFLLVSIVLNKE